jgi:esterase/lipase superfamily enzyme
MDDAQILARALAQAWERIAPLLGPERQRLEYELIGLLRSLEQTDAKERADAVAATLALFKPLPAAHALLLQALRSAQAGQAKGSAAPAGNLPAERYTTFPVFFGTDRALLGPRGADAAIAFGPGRGELTFGVAEVSIPDDARMGRIDRPRWWKLEFRPDPNKHLVLHGAQVLDAGAFAARARSLVGGAAKKEVLVFVHGFRVTFDDALSTAAQLAYDLHFEGLAALYSWPSEGALARYTVDEGNVRWSRPHFAQFLTVLREQTGADAIHLIAHSMGNRLLLDGLEALPAARTGAAPWREVVCAAPDVDAATFKEQVGSLHRKAHRFTLYASSKDKALMVSETVHGYPRAGQSGMGMVLAPALDTVDATAVDTSLLGHSCYAENRSVLSDLFNLIRHGHAPLDRGLASLKRYGLPYWAFRG